MHHLVGENGRYRWSDTGKSARIKRRIGNPHTIDLSKKYRGVENPITAAKCWKDRPFYLGDPPKGAEISFYVLEQDMAANPPFIKVQYVEAEREPLIPSANNAARLYTSDGR